MSAAFDPGLAAWVRPFADAMIADAPFHRWAGLRLLAVGRGTASVGFAATGDMLVFGKYVHGGVLNGLLEPPGLLCLLSELDEAETAMTIDIHVQHLRSIRAGEDVVLAGRFLRRGRGTAFCAVEASVAGETCTSARITKTITKKADQP